MYNPLTKIDTSKIDYKLILSIIFITSLVLSIILIFRGNNGGKIDKHKTEIKALHKSNDSLWSALKISQDNVLKHDVKFNILQKKYNIIEAKNIQLNTQIKRLKIKKDAIPNHVDSLPANDIKSEFDKYLERRNTNNN